MKNEQSMDRALIERFLQLIPDAYKSEFKLRLTQNPNLEFVNVFQHFLDMHDDHDESDQADNRATMEFNWTITYDFSIVAKTIDNALIYVEFTEALILNYKAIDTNMKNRTI